jgi:molybdate transport system regulatory protein
MHVKPNFRFWIYSDSGAGVFGDGKVRLLRAIDEQGSLREAARILDISYRKAWDDLKKAEACLGITLVHRLRGGRNGGTMHLTETGRQAVSCYETFRDKVEQQIRIQFETFKGEMNLC